MEYRAEQPKPAAPERRSSARPTLLNPYFAPIIGIEGVGPRFAAMLGKLLDLPGSGSPRIIDLLLHLPSGLTDRRAQPSIAEAVTGQLATLLVRVKKHYPTPRSNSRAPYRIICEDDTGDIELIFFHAERAYLERQLPIGAMRLLSGRVERYGAKLQMPHPDYIVAENERDKLPGLEPVYPLTQGLTQKFLYKTVGRAFDTLPRLPEWLDDSILAAKGWPGFNDALRALHRPADDGDVERHGQARGAPRFR